MSNSGNRDVDASPAEPSRPPKSKGYRADQCRRRRHRHKIPKPPHKLSQEEVSIGLASEIQPDGKRHPQGRPRLCVRIDDPHRRRHPAHLLHNWQEHNVRLRLYGPGVCLYPNSRGPCYGQVVHLFTDRLHHTVVAQVFAFVLQPMRAAPLQPTWIPGHAALARRPLGAKTLYNTCAAHYQRP